MVITPNTDLYLVKVPLEIDDNNQLTFANKTAQFNYFNSLDKISGDGKFTYQRKDGVIRFGALIDDILEYNYVMYRNTNYSNKWFYAYITKMEYVNDTMTAITIKSDVWQCWQFDLSYKPVLIDREHTNDDTVGNNLLEEGLELGDLVTNGNVQNFGEASTYKIVVEVSQIENEGQDQTLHHVWMDGSDHDATPNLNDVSRGTTPILLSSLSDLDTLRDVYDYAGLSDSIINVYMTPTSLTDVIYGITLVATRSGSVDIKTVSASVPAEKTGVYSLGNKTFTRPTAIGSYIPRNNKLLTYPFCYFNISNNAGTSLPYRYEDFGETVQFNIEGTFGVSGNVKAIPINYKDISASENALDYSISGAKYPVCSWKSDSYTNWLTQNAVNMASQWTSNLVGGALTTIGGGVAGGGLGALQGGTQLVTSLINTAREQHLAKTRANLVPDQVRGNLNAGDFTWAKYKSPFTYLPMCVRQEIAECIDGYFDQFGYKCNKVKLPNITGRRNWNYVKTIGCYIEADIPQDDLQEIKSMFDKGVTFWHNPATFADYSQANDII